ncbi:MAG: nadA [Dehalococcoidales bacterium]|nr:nadA [Dehalococcoidales bacterium]
MMDDRGAELIEKIITLKKKRKAIILSHNYQLGEVQDIADFTGDSLELSQQAAKTDADVIVFCGVHFMAETASILCPDKIVLLPDLHAGCPMANMVTAEGLRQKKKEYPRATVVCYINSSAAVKAESDVCCTSANAVRLVDKLPDTEEIIFVPDQYLGSYVASQTGRKMILWPGYCPTHSRILPQHILRLRKEYPGAKVVVHPECRTEVITLADAVLSTSGICRFARETDAEEIIIGTEIGILHRLRKENPQKKFIPVSEQAVCPRMKLITLDTILWSLENMLNQVKVPEKTRLKAKAAVDKMIEAV